VERDLNLFFVGRYEIGILLFIDLYTNRNDASTKNHLEEDVLHEDATTSNENVCVMNPGLGGLTSTKLCPGRHEWVEALSPLCLELNLV